MRNPLRVRRYDRGYSLAAIVCLCTHYVTRGGDGRLIAFFWLFGALAVLYAMAMLSVFKARVTVHSLGHFLAFQAAAGLGIGSRLEEMAGMMVVFVEFGVTAIVVLGARVPLCRPCIWRG